MTIKVVDKVIIEIKKIVLEFSLVYIHLGMK
jgi:hypothetical protein